MPGPGVHCSYTTDSTHSLIIMVIDRYQLGIRVSLFFFWGGGGGEEGELRWVDPSAFAKHIKLTTTIISFRIRKILYSFDQTLLSISRRTSGSAEHTCNICHSRLVATPRPLLY